MPLGEAAVNGHTQTVIKFLDCGAESEAKDTQGRTALFRAAGDDQIYVCEDLLKRGASPNPGLAILDYEDCNWPMTPLQITAFFNFVAIADLLVEYKVNLEERDGMGRTALYVAAWKSNLHVCKTLIAAGADFDTQASNHSAVSIAARNGHMEVVQVLLEGGASAMPPPFVKGRKWKNFEFGPDVTTGRKKDILELLRARKHG